MSWFVELTKSKRAKFLLVSWCGPKVKVMRKAKLSVHIADVKKVMASFAVEVSVSSIDDLKDSEIQLLLKKAMVILINSGCQL
jgi:Cofilin/tropomyosin-type actin-binding protein